MIDREAMQRLYRYGVALAADEATAYDLLQDALEAGLRHGPARPEALEAYVRTAMRNRHIDQWRRAQRFPSESLDDPDRRPGATPLDIDPRVLENIVVAHHDVQRILEQLTPDEREILYYWAVEEYTAREIAERLETPRGTILSRIHRLRKKIRALPGVAEQPPSGGQAA